MDPILWIKCDLLGFPIAPADEVILSGTRILHQYAFVVTHSEIFEPIFYLNLDFKCFIFKAQRTDFRHIHSQGETACICKTNADVGDGFVFESTFYGKLIYVFLTSWPLFGNCASFGGLFYVDL